MNRKIKTFFSAVTCSSLLFSYLNIPLISEVLADENEGEISGEVVFQDFEDASTVDIYPSAHGSGELSQEDVFRGSQSLKYKNTETDNPGEAGVFIKNKTPIDVSGYEYVAFWIKDSGSNDAGIEVKDASGKGTQWEWQTSPPAVESEWSQLFMPLDNFREEIDWTQVNEVMITEYWANDYYIDQITFTNVLEQDLLVTASVDSGNYLTPQEVALNNVNQATIYYTIDGSEPSTSSLQYESAIIIESDTEMKVLAVKDGVRSRVQTFNYVIAEESEVVTGGIFEDFEEEQSVILTSTTRVNAELTTSEFYAGNQSLHYEVTESGDPEVTSGSILVEKSSPIDTTGYSHVSFWIKDVQGNNGIKVALQDAANKEGDFGAESWVDGAEKDVWTPLSVPLDGLTELQGIRFGEWNSGFYYIDHIQLTNFDITQLNAKSSVESGTYHVDQIIELSSELGENIYYTTDGTEPNTSAYLYASPITISEDTVLKVVAEKDGIVGKVQTYSYTINTFKLENRQATWFQTFDENSESFEVSPAGTTGKIVQDEERNSKVLEYRVLDSDSPEIHNGAIQINSEYPVDVSHLNYLIFYIKDTQGSNNMKLSLIDKNGNETDFGAAGWRDGLNTKNNEWSQYYVALEDLTGAIDLTAVTGVRIGQWNAGTYYIDSVYFDNYLLTGEPELIPAEPVVSVEDGYRFVDSLEVHLANPTGEPIYYTTDGSIPTVHSTPYQGPIVLENTTALNVAAIARGMSSSIGTYTYEKVATLLPSVNASQSSGTYSTVFSVDLTTEDEATIYYTTDGTIPTTASNQYSESIEINQTTVLRAMAIKGEESSNISTFDYRFPTTPIAPTFSMEVEEHHEGFHLELMADPMGTIYYTTNGEVPTTASTRYKEPIHIGSSTDVKAIVVVDELASDVAEKNYKLIPRELNADKPAGEYLNDVVVELRGEHGYLEIYYTLDGSLPTENGYEPTETAVHYTGPIYLTEDTEIKAVGRFGGSKYFTEVKIFSYKILADAEATAPRIRPEAGTYGERQTVSITTTTRDAKIYYTLDGTTPSVQSTLYTGEFTVTKDTTVRAITVKNNQISEITTTDYVITPQASPFLKTDGKVMRNNFGSGNVVQLRGTNVGGWLVMEEWQSPVNSPDQQTTIQVLTERFGEEKAWELINHFQDTWFTEADFDVLQEEGVNLLRLPITHYEMANEDGSLKAKGRERLEWFLQEAEKRGIYVLIDLHGAYGSQNGNDHSGDTTYPGVGDFFGNEENIQKTIRLWEEIAAIGKGNPWIAGYDLLNEPGGAYGTEQFEAYDRLYQAVRKVDPDHIIHMQAIWDPVHLPNPEFYQWENVVYQYHFYGWDKLNDLDYQKGFIDSKVKMVNEDTNYNVPLFVGEFTFFENVDSWEYGMSTFDREGWSYTSWTYKVSGENSSWGMYTAPRTSNEIADIYTDDFDTIKAKWSVTTADGFTRNEPIANVLSKYFKGVSLETGDTEAPVISGEDGTVKVGTTQSVGEIIDLHIKDNLDGVLYPARIENDVTTATSVEISPFDSNILGNQTITVTATDSSDNTSSAAFMITVVDVSEEDSEEGSDEEETTDSTDNSQIKENETDSSDKTATSTSSSTDEKIAERDGELPKTGEQNSVTLFVLGVVMVIGSVAVWIMTRKRVKR